MTPLPSIGTVVEVFGPDPDSARWDVTAWDEPGHGWDVSGWRDVTGLAMSAELQWGADRQVGVLSVASAGRLSVKSYDPLRLLDPSNTASPLWSVLRPGTPVRLRYAGAGTPVPGSLANPSFELDPPLVGWTPTAPALAERSPLAGAPDGAYTLRLVGDGVAVSPAVSQVVPVIPGQVVSITAQVRVAAGGEARLRVDALDVNGSAATLLTAATVLPDFGSIGGTVTVPPSVAGLRVHLYLLGTPAAGIAARFDALTYTWTGGTSGLVIRSGWLDTIAYSLADRTGEWRASDAIPLLVQARTVVPGSGVPTTLRALARWLVARTAVPVTVEADPEDGDPTIGPTPAAASDGTLGVWDWVLVAAADCLRATWVDHDNVLRFRSYGDPRDLGLVVGGAAGIPIEDLVPTADLDAVYNVVAARPTTTTWTEVQNAESVRRYGARRLDRDRVTPNTPWWVANVLADRQEASLDYAPRTLRLRDVTDLDALVTAGMVDTVRVLVDAAVPSVEVAAALLGVTLAIDPESGYSADVVAYVPASAWDDAYTPPPDPPDPHPPTTVRVTRTYACTKDSRLHRTSGGAEYGSGTEGQLPVGSWSGSKNRAILDFASIPWTGVVKVVSARLLVTTSSQVNVGFGSSPKVEVRRITGSWSEGSASSPSGSNAVTWPGPSVTTSGAKQVAVSGGQGVRVGLDVSAIARAWAPTAAGGSAATKRGIAIYSVAESDPSRTTEFLSREGPAASDPVLELTLDVVA